MGGAGVRGSGGQGSPRSRPQIQTQHRGAEAEARVVQRVCKEEAARSCQRALREPVFKFHVGFTPAENVISGMAGLRVTHGPLKTSASVKRGGHSGRRERPCGHHPPAGPAIVVVAGTHSAAGALLASTRLAERRLSARAGLRNAAVSLRLQRASAGR